jgi:hypothetical protein
MANNYKLIIVLSFCFFCLQASAQERIETDRPDQTESPFLVPKNYFQFEFGFNMEKDQLNGLKTTTYVIPTSLLKYGINENVELRLELQSQNSRSTFNNIKTSASALQPVELGFKAKLWEEKGIIPKTSFILHTTLPKLSSKEFKSLSAAPNFRFTLQNTLSDNWGLGYNLGMEWDGENTTPAYIYTFAPGFSINEKWAGYFEVYGALKKEETPEHAIDGGLYYFPNNNIKLDISGGYGLTKTATDFYVALGISFRFKG